VRALILNTAAQEDLRRLREYAESHRFPIERLRQLAKTRSPIGDTDSNLCCVVPDGFQVCFSIEQHPGGWMRHASISVNKPASLPAEPAVDLLIGELGFRYQTGNPGILTYLEGNHAVNIIEPISEADLSLMESNGEPTNTTNNGFGSLHPEPAASREAVT
jgi:hypothetical protein